MASNRPTTRNWSSTRLRDVIIPMAKKSAHSGEERERESAAQDGKPKRSASCSEAEFLDALFMAKNV